MALPYSLLIFDWDGTVMDSTAHIVQSALKAIEDCSLPAIQPHAIRQLIGLSRHEVLRRCYPDLSEKQAYELEIRYEHHFFRPGPQTVAPFEGAVDVIRQLHQDGYAMAVATGKSRRGLEADFDAFDLREYFKATCCGDESYSKPDPEMVNEILYSTATEASQALMIGDTEYDLIMGKAANVDCLAVSYGVQCEEELMNLKPQGCISDITQLPDWLKSQRKQSVK